MTLGTGLKMNLCVSYIDLKTPFMAEMNNYISTGGSKGARDIKSNVKGTQPS